MNDQEKARMEFLIRDGVAKAIVKHEVKYHKTRFPKCPECGNCVRIQSGVDGSGAPVSDIDCLSESCGYKFFVIGESKKEDC